MATRAEIAADVAARKAAFLRAYGGNYIISEALAEVGCSRQNLLDWRKSDETFARAFEAVEADQTDKIKKLALKHAGAIPWSPEEIDKRLPKYSNPRMVEVLLRRDPRYRDGGISFNNVMALTINGISGDELKKLVSPDSPRAANIDAEVEVQDPKARLAPGEGDIPFAKIESATSIPAVMAGMLESRMARLDRATAEGRE